MSNRAASNPRPWRRIPHTVELANTPIDRCAVLAGGIVELANLLGVAVSTLRNRRRSAQGHFASNDGPMVERAFALRGYALPPGFVSDTGVFDTPAKIGREAALAQLSEQTGKVS